MRRITIKKAGLAGIIAAGAVAALALTGCAAAEGNPTGTWRANPAPETGEVPELVLADGGGLSGTDGCNQLAGGWTRNGADATFEDVATTLMACEGVDTWLVDLASAKAVGATLTVYDVGGNVIGELQRAS